MNHFRVARHTVQLDLIKRFYVDALGMKLLGAFDHDGYKGIFIGLEDQTWHLEFTQSDDSPKHEADEDDLLVFYINEKQLFETCIARIEGFGCTEVRAKNPYWNQWGKTYLDPDGFRIVVCNRVWSNH